MRRSEDVAVALVTGASSGIGAALARLMSDLGMVVAATARREAELARLAADISAVGGRCVPFPADLSDRDQVLALIPSVVQQLGRIDALVNCAGLVEQQPMHELDVASWDRVFDVNFRAPAVLTSQVLPGMRERRRGFIVNISSEEGVATYEGTGAYGLSKHALCGLTELIQSENQHLGIKAWAICPGEVASERAVSLSTANAGRRYLAVDDVVALVRFLLTQGANVKMGPTILIRTMLDPYSDDDPSAV